MGADLYREPETDDMVAAKKDFDVAVKVRKDREADLALARANGTDEAFAAGAIDGAQAEVNAAYDRMFPDSHYFRDSYNSTSVFWRLGLSWWQDLDAYVNADNDLEPEGARRLADEVERRELDGLPKTAADLNDMHLSTDGKSAAEACAEWQKYFAEKKARLIKFLRDAADAGDKIHCSC